MNSTNLETLSLLEILPEDEQLLAKEFVKRMVLAWDPDYTKLTAKEMESLNIAEEQIKKGEVISQNKLLKELGI